MSVRPLKLVGMKNMKTPSKLEAQTNFIKKDPNQLYNFPMDDIT